MAPRKTTDKGKAPMTAAEIDALERSATRSRNTGIVIRDTTVSGQRTRGRPRAIRVEPNIPPVVPPEEQVFPDLEPEVPQAPIEEIFHRAQASMPGSSQRAIPRDEPRVVPTPDNRMSAMIEALLKVVQSFQETTQAQPQQRATTSTVLPSLSSPRRPPNPIAPEIVRADDREYRGKVQEDRDRADMKAFQDMHPPTFQGEIDFRVTDKWVTRMEKIFEYLRCSDEQRVRYATFMLEGEAENWWRTLRFSLPPGRQLSWAEFLEQFYQHYVPESERAKREMEFMSLIQGKLSVAEYNAQFQALIKFAPWAQTNPLAATRKFHQGLKLSIRRSLAVLKMTEYNEVLERALMVEREEEEFGKVRDKRKEGRVDSQGRRQKPRLGFAKPGFGGNACYQCGQTGHRKAECPQLIGQVPRATQRPPVPMLVQP